MQKLSEVELDAIRQQMAGRERMSVEEARQAVMNHCSVIPSRGFYFVEQLIRSGCMISDKQWVISVPPRKQ